jgi:hypothetical protein
MKDLKQPRRTKTLSNILLSTTMIILLTLWLILANLGQSSIPLDNIPAQVEFILDSTPLTDTHNDFPMKLLYHFHNKISYQDLETLPEAAGFSGFDTDLGRLKKVFFVALTPRDALEQSFGVLTCNVVTLIS